MLALVLCGGQSTRMGSDKGLLQPNAKTWAAMAVELLAKQNLPVYLSVNELQLPYYESFFLQEQLIVDAENVSLHGPLLGILSAHLRYPQQAVLALACDMPLMQSSILKQLILTAKTQPDFDAWLFKNNGQPEPLCAIYSARALALVLELLHAGKLYKHSLKFMLEQINPFYITLSAEQESYFRNINSHAELNGL